MSISFSADRHAELVASLNQATDALDDILDHLDSEVGAVHSQWTGAAQAAYEHAQREWTSTMGALRNALRTATNAAESAGSRLAQAERDVAAIWE
ncbi:WXG100 family type VII secretion target [Microbacterium sp. SORGH_AS_0862]|uniref:WXG100 family type VII secretion target n=1 Tax=Microbacterium sp. SORGH_AS_0862 TaxID=3041789 RepID=UPI00278FA0D1|nr:WXG100 family type VII secretion target [Microbacterium sp. SORGH_AS_0862]MDQ1206230.1 early secretory antigenic target protein ESAT-6 [Microbacterium sp. SORGH_AS_0862]